MHLRFLMSVSFRVARNLFMLLSLLAVSNLRSYAQQPVLCQFGGGVGQQGYTASQLHNGMKVIGGTTFPWVGRTGNGPVTVYGTVNIIGTYGYATVPFNIQNVTVTLNGQACVVVPNPYDTTHLQGSWYYSGPQIVVPDGPTSWQLTISAYYNGVLMRNTNGFIPASYTYNCNVYSVESEPSYQTTDFVALSNACSLVPSGMDTYIIGAQTSIAHSNNREIKDQFRVTPPSGVTDMSGITVGIVQTLASITWGTLHGTLMANSMSPSTPCTLTNTFPGAPFWDGDGLTPCYYSSGSVQTVAYGASVPFTSNTLSVEDTPNTLLPGLFPANSRNVSWGMLNGSPDLDSINDFEDMLIASSPDCPGICVPIQGYFTWTDTISGCLQGDGTWSGGGITGGATDTLAPPVTSILRGSANSKRVQVCTPSM